MKETEVRMVDIQGPEDMEILMHRQVSTPGLELVSLQIILDGVCKLRVRDIPAERVHVDIPLALMSP